MDQKRSGLAVERDDSETNLIKTLAILNEIGVRINRLGMGHDLPATLKLIVEGAVEAAGANQPGAGPNASAVIWIYDEARREFDPDSRVSAGEPDGTSTDDFPRPNGLGRQAIRHRRRLLSYEPSAPRATQIHPAKYQAGARSLVCCPLIVGDEIVGILYVYRCDERRFSKVELLTLDSFVNLAAIAIHHGRQVGGLSRALARKISELEKLERASHLISSRTNLHETLQEILSIGLDMTAAQYGSFELHDKKRGVLTIRALAGRKKDFSTSGPPLPVDERSVVGWVASRQQSLLISDLRDPQWQAIYHPLPVDQEMRSELAVPLIGTGGGLEGVLNIESPLPDAFTAEDRYLLETLATQAVIALQEIRLLDAILEIGEVLLTAEGLELFGLIVDRACELINVPVGAIWTVSEGDTLVLRQSTEGLRRGEKLSLERSLTGQAIRLRRAITVDDVRTHPDFEYRELAVEQGWVSAIIVPLLMPDARRRALGSFSLYANRLRDFSDWDKKLLTLLANHAAVAIHDADQLAQLKKARDRQAIAETFAAVGDMAANLLHQLNNKIGAIPARVQGIEDKCDEAVSAFPYLAENLKEIEHSARQAMAIVRDSMAHLRPVKRQPVEVARCLELALQRATLPATVKVHRAGLKNLPRVFAGEQQLAMVFYNLIDNALTAMQGAGELHLSGVWQGAEVIVTVADTGPGIPSELQSHLFEFSPQPITAHERPSPRLGFGLWWVKTLLDRFDGRLLLTSEPGWGAAFQVCLPAEKGQ
ncbi:MAG: GAF domain-containing sensor histidine kinase [Chloroflexota bacterium]